MAWGVLLAVHEDRARQLAKRLPAFLVALVAIPLLVHPVFSETWHRVIYECLMVPLIQPAGIRNGCLETCSFFNAG